MPSEKNKKNSSKSLFSWADIFCSKTGYKIYIYVYKWQKVSECADAENKWKNSFQYQSRCSVSNRHLGISAYDSFLRKRKSIPKDTENSYKRSTNLFNLELNKSFRKICTNNPYFILSV